MALATLAEKEGVVSQRLEISCSSCRRFRMEISVKDKAVARLVCHCGAQTLLVIEPDRYSVVQQKS